MREQRDCPLLLVADDDPTSLQMMYDLLAGAGFEIIVADDGETVLEYVREKVPDLILLDVVMPRLGGIETCKRFKENPEHKEVPVIFLTAHDDSQHRLQTFQVGGVDYIPKPFEAAELLARVQTHISIRRLTKELRAQNARLQDEIRERTAGEIQREQLTRELGRAKEQVERELAERVRAEEARITLQAKIITSQRERLLELSTPLIPITDRIVVMPLIGAMDEERMQQAMETALQGVAARGAEFVILDITGIRAIDASVAGMLVRTSDGLRLLGARALVTGVSPVVAQMLVEIDVLLGSLVTKATLQAGIAHAMNATRAVTSSHRRQGDGLLEHHRPR